MTTAEIIAGLKECHKAIPGDYNFADATATDYLIRRLRGEDAPGMVILAKADISQFVTKYGEGDMAKAALSTDSDQALFGAMLTKITDWLEYQSQDGVGVAVNETEAMIAEARQLLATIGR